MVAINRKKLKYSDLVPLTHSAESVFFQVHSFIRDIDGMHADEALDELCKIIQIKVMDEERHLDNENLKLQTYIYNNANEFYDSIIDFQSVCLNENGFAVEHNKKIKLSPPALYKVVELFQKYNFTKTPLDIKGRAFQNLFLPSVRAGMGQYFTPLPVVKFIIECVNPTSYDYVLDPFCGSGYFLTESMKYIRENENESVALRFLQRKYFGIEKSERMARVASTDFRLSGSNEVNIECNDSLLPFDIFDNIKPGFFDYVLTNPPFGSLLGKESLSFLDDFVLSKDKKSIPLEILGIERSLQFLKPEGKLVIVIPDGILVNTQMKYVRDWLSTVATISAVISLPSDTFTPFGANVKTSILFMKKNGKSKTNSKTFLGKFDNSFDDVEGSEFLQMKEKLKIHLQGEGW